MSQILSNQPAQNLSSDQPAGLDKAPKLARFAELQAIGVIKRDSGQNTEFEKLRAELGIKP